MSKHWTIISILMLALLMVMALTGCPRSQKPIPYTPAKRPEGSPIVAASQGDSKKQTSSEKVVEEEQIDKGQEATRSETTGEPKAEETKVEGESSPSEKAEQENGEGTQEDEDSSSSEEKDKPVPSADGSKEGKFIPADKLQSEMTEVVYAMFDTTQGSILIAIYPEIAPISSNHFIKLVRNGFYNRIEIHRFEPGFVVQMGQVKDQSFRKHGMTLESIPDEPNLSEHAPMTVAFAKSFQNGQLVPNSASTQFFINLGYNPHLNRDFTVMGQVVEGQEVVKRLRVGDRINKAYIIEGPEFKRKYGTFPEAK